MLRIRLRNIFRGKLFLKSDSCTIISFVRRDVLVNLL